MITNSVRAGHSDFLDPITAHGFQVHSVLFHIRSQCQFALLAHRTGLIDTFPYLNGINGLWTIPSVSVCCPDIQAYRIRQCSAPLYFATDLTATFCGNIIMRIRLPLTVSVFPRIHYWISEVICQKVSHLTNARHTRIPSTLTKRSSLGYL